MIATSMMLRGVKTLSGTSFCLRGHEYTIGTGCKPCHSIRQAEARKRLAEGPTPRVRVLPPPAVQPANPFMLSPEALKVERDESIKRQKAAIQPALDRVREMMAMEQAMDVTGALSFGQSRRGQHKRVRCEGCGDIFFRKRVGRPTKLCVDCR